jgi:glycosidase
MNRIIRNAGFILLAGLLMLSCCQKNEQKAIKPRIVTKITHAEWTRNAVIYEVNIRQYTPEGTLEAFRKHLPRLKDLGIDILWLMPIHPIGETERKGQLGSYYSVKDYMAVNPEFGTLEDLKKVVNEAHNLGMHVILDWVANHTAWDNELMTDHPEWYMKDSLGNFVSPYDWTDVVRLNYENDSLRKYMIDALKFWIREADIDGYRCDVAGMVPIDFWEDARTELDKIKPVFMLAENEDIPELLIEAFDMNYAWEFHHLMNNTAQGKANVDTLRQYFKKEEKLYGKNVYRMQFLSNHDENSWNGTVQERLGDASEVMSVLYFTVPGMPLIYNGQEAGMNKRLRFFDRDTIDWSDLSMSSFYKKLIALKTDNKALWNGKFGGSFDMVNNSNSGNIFIFLREKEGSKVVVFLNLSDKNQSFTLESKEIRGNYTEVFSNKNVKFGKKITMDLPGWGYKVYLPD